jgi:peptidoglycan hydrolase-like protein with peptidoglycan-binding domain
MLPSYNQIPDGYYIQETYKAGKDISGKAVLSGQGALFFLPET